VDPTIEEGEQRRRLRSVVVVVEASSYTGATVPVGQMARRQHGGSWGGGHMDLVMVEAVKEAPAWTRRRQRRRGKIW
jgi:hypothetical protein